jgi:hypothetical protein
MTDHRPVTDQAKPAGSDTTVGADKPNQPNQQGEALAAHPGADASSSLLDGTLDPTYQLMMQASKKASTDGGGKTPSSAANDVLKKNGTLTDLTVNYHETGREPPQSDAVGARTSHDSGEQQRLAYMQTTVQNFLPVLLAADGAKPDAALQSTIAAKQNDIKLEAERGQFGPQTRAAYGQYVDWLEKTALPSTYRDLHIFGLPADEPGDKGAKAPALDLKINRNTVPDDQQLQRLDDAAKWAQRADGRVQVAQDALLKKVDGDFTATVTRMHLPNGWIQDVDKDHNRWRQSVGPLIDGALTVRSNIEILDELSKAGGSNLLASILPPDVGIKRDATGKIAGMHLDLPQGWDLTQPDNKLRSDRLNALLAETNALVAPTIPQLQTIAGHPERALTWGDQPVKGMKGTFDQSGNFLGLIDKNDKPAAGLHTEDVNLVESRFTIEEKDNKIVVHQQVQAQAVPWWGYQNLIGVKDVGKKIDITRTFNPTDSVVVRTDSGYEVKQAQDLAGYKNWQMGKLYGEKALMGALDVGMIASGITETGASLKAARLADVGMTGWDLLSRGAAKGLMTKEGVDISGRMLAGQAGKGMMRMTIGAAGLLNNAGANDTGFGQAVNTARSVYFLADASLGLGTGGVKLAKWALNGGESTLGAGRLGIAGLTAGSNAENFYRATHGVFKASEYGFMPLAAIDLSSVVHKMNNDKNAHVVRAAEIVVSDQPKAEGAN